MHTKLIYTQYSISFQVCTSKACIETREVLHHLQERFIRTAEQLAEAETLLAEVAPTSSAPSPQSPKSPTCGNLLLAIRKTINEPTGTSSSLATQQRLIGRLERWINAKLTQHEALEAQLRERCINLEVELAKSSSDVCFNLLRDFSDPNDCSLLFFAIVFFQVDPTVLKSILDAQKEELNDVYSKLKQSQEELEATKALYESKVRMLLLDEIYIIENAPSSLHVSKLAY